MWDEQDTAILGWVALPGGDTASIFNHQKGIARRPLGFWGIHHHVSGFMIPWLDDSLPRNGIGDTVRHSEGHAFVAA